MSPRNSLGRSLIRRNYLLLCVVLFLLIASSACAPEEPVEPMPTRDTSEANLSSIRAAVADFMQSYNSGDVERFVALFDDDAIRFPPNSQPIEGIDRIRANTITIFETYDRDVTVNLIESRFSGDFAITRGTWAVRLTPKSDGGETSEDVGSWLNVSVRGEDGRWRISRNIWNSDQPQGN